MPLTDLCSPMPAAEVKPVEVAIGGGGGRMTSLPTTSPVVLLLLKPRFLPLGILTQNGGDQQIVASVRLSIRSLGRNHGDSVEL